MTTSLKQYMTPPATIFKYQSFSAYAIKNLQTSSLYVNSPARFNDPYDCALIAIITSPPEKLSQLPEAFAKSTAYGPAAKAKASSLSPKQLEEEICRGGSEKIRQLRDEFVKNRGVACFSATKDNLLMWAHYGDRHKGFCLEFDTTAAPFNKIRPVRYREKMPELSVWDFVLNKNHEELTELFCTKSTHWSYEQEWRMLCECANTPYTYSQEALKAIYLGAEMPKEHRTEIADIARLKFPCVAIYAGRRSQTYFQIVFEPIAN